MQLIVRGKARFIRATRICLGVGRADKQCFVLTFQEGLDLCGPDSVPVLIFCGYRSASIAIGGVESEAQLREVTLSLG